jgi:hypothetical protein
MTLEEQARKAEQNNDWLRAAKLWQLACRPDDYEACKRIYDSNAFGDIYRENVLLNAGEEPDKCENPRVWCKWFDIMEEEYRKMHCTEEGQQLFKAVQYNSENKLKYFNAYENV